MGKGTCEAGSITSDRTVGRELRLKLLRDTMMTNGLARMAYGQQKPLENGPSPIMVQT